MDQKRLHKIIGFAVFIIALFTYASTVQPSVSFWDCGEFIASAVYMQVPHPPGTPFFLLLGRLFSMIPFVANLGLRVNAISVLSSGLTIMFLYLIAVKLIENYKGKEYKSNLDALGTYIAAAIGALSLAFSDTFWFNAVEAEVYANSTFFIAFVTWLMMLWNEKADQKDNEKYLIFIAYLIGLSTGVHLMAVLAIVPVVMVVIFRKYLTDEAMLKKTGQLFLIHAGIILVIAGIMWASMTDTTPPSMEQYKEVDMRFLMIMSVISVIFMGAFWKKIFQRNSFYLPLIIGGVALVAVYPGTVKYIPNFISDFAGHNPAMDLLLIAGIFAVLGYGIYWSKRENKATLNLVFKCAIFVIVGFSSYTMIIVRANQDPPINLNSPKTVPEVVSYLNREQYGDFPTFKRRYSREPNQQAIYTNYDSDLDFLLRYQMDEMFNRYLMWNYVGRISTVQGAGVDWTELLGIPFFLGLFGLYFHYRRDWKMASVFLVMFIFLGVLTAFYQNQQQPQPRERDYFYVGAFFVYSIWIALGVRGILDLLRENFKDVKFLNPVYSLVLIVGFIAVPLNMLNANYFDHDRSDNYVPWDYSYNMLQSVAPNAVLFTNGDNDTFPLWYLQDVEGVRRDVRIANLSLINTPWYIKQLKNNTPYGTDKVAMSLSDTQIDRLSPVQWQPRNMSLEVPDSIIEKYNIKDTSIVNTNRITWRMDNTVTFGNTKAVRTQDLVVLDIIRATKWQRPIYFAATCSDDSKLSLQDYLQTEGLAFRLTPVKDTDNLENVNEPILRKQLMDEPDGFSRTYQPGFKFRGLNDSTIFYDDNHLRMTGNYRNTYIRLALYYLNKKRDSSKVIETLDMMQKKVPRSVIPIDYRIKNDISLIYLRAGAKDKYKELAKEVITTALRRLEANPRNFEQYYNPYQLLITHYENLKEYDKALGILLRLQSYVPNEPGINALINKFKRLAKADSSEVNPKTLKEGSEN